MQGGTAQAKRPEPLDGHPKYQKVRGVAGWLAGSSTQGPVS